MQSWALWAIFNGMPFAVAVVLGLALPAFVLMLARSFEAGIVYLCVVLAIDAAVLQGGAIYLGIHVHPSDLAYGAFFVAALARWLFVHEPGQRPARSRSFLLLVALAVLGIVVGLATEGRRAGVQGREAFYALSCAGWAMSFAIDEQRLRRLLHGLAAICFVLLAVSAYRWVVYFVPVPDLLPPDGQWSPDVATRVIASHETLLLAQWLVLGLVFGTRGAGALSLSRWMAPVLLAAVVALQHRSVWIALVVGLLVALAVSRRAQQSRPLQLATLLAAAMVVTVPLVLSERLAPLSQEIGQSAANAVSARGTVHARLADWRRELGSFVREKPQVWLVGRGYGRDTTRLHITETGERQVVRFGLHNHYLSLLVHHGVLGLGAFVVLMGSAALALWRVLKAATPQDRGSSGAPLLLVLLGMGAAYHLPYGSDPVQHLLIGVAVAYAATLRRAQTAARAGAAPGSPGASGEQGAHAGSTGTGASVRPGSPEGRPKPVAQDVAWR